MKQGLPLRARSTCSQGQTLPHRPNVYLFWASEGLATVVAQTVGYPVKK